MRKGLLIDKDKMGDYEIEKGYASYRTIVKYGIGDIVLCNNIINIDDSVFDNMESMKNLEDVEIYQYYLCNLNKFDKEIALESGLIVSYSDLLDCDVLCVDHFGTSWDCVLTDIKLFDNLEDLKKYEESEDNE